MSKVQQNWYHKGQMENIEHLRGIKGRDNRNYLKEVAIYMVKKVEGNASRVTLWLSIGAMLITIGMTFIPWAVGKVVDSGVQAERRENERKMLEGQSKQTETLSDGFKKLDKRMDEVYTLAQSNQLNNQSYFIYIIQRIPALSWREKERAIEQVKAGKPLGMKQGTYAGGDGLWPTKE